MRIREIRESEVTKLLTCLTQLAEHHNSVSINFRGFYPSRPYEETLDAFRADLKSGRSHIAVIESSDAIAGFCKIDIAGKSGKLDYLVVLQKHRRKGYGKQLMDWAMASFRKHNVNQIEVKVVDGNDAIHLYEKYGFQVKSHILWYCGE